MHFTEIQDIITDDNRRWKARRWFKRVHTFIQLIRSYRYTWTANCSIQIRIYFYIKTIYLRDYLVFERLRRCTFTTANCVCLTPYIQTMTCILRTPRQRTFHCWTDIIPKYVCIWVLLYIVLYFDLIFNSYKPA
jgi:hypothetical protein